MAERIHERKIHRPPRRDQPPGDRRKNPLARLTLPHRVRELADRFDRSGQKEIAQELRAAAEAIELGRKERKGRKGPARPMSAELFDVD